MVRNQCRRPLTYPNQRLRQHASLVLVMQRQKYACLQNGELRLKSKTVTPSLHAMIAKLVNTSVSWPAAMVGVGSNPILGRLGVGAMR